MNAPPPTSQRLVATVVERHRRRPVRCDRCGQPGATHHVTVTVHQQPRRGWPACETCAPPVAAAAVAEAFGCQQGTFDPLPPDSPHAVASPDAPAADDVSWPHRADAALAEQAAAWWEAIDHDELADAAARQLDAVLASAQWTPDRSRLLTLAQDAAADVTGLSRTMPDPGPDRTAWLLAWGHADAWAQATIDRLVESAAA